MPIELLTIGPVHTLLQLVVYALPARRVLCTTGFNTAEIEVSNDGIIWSDVPFILGTPFQFPASAKFIRTFEGSIDLTLKAA